MTVTVTGIDNGPLLALAEPLIKGEESCRLTAYRDTRGIWTIAWGRADADVHEGMTCTQAQADAWFDAKVISIITSYDRIIPWWRQMALPRQAVLLDMGYQLGVNGTLRFGKALDAMKVGDWPEAKRQMLASTWDCQTPERADIEADIIESGEMPSHA